MAVIPNTTTTTSLTPSKIQEIDFVSRFETKMTAFYEILGVMRPLAKENGTKLKTYKAKIEALQDGNVAEGDEVPLSEVTSEAVDYKDLVLEKYAKSTTAEAIFKYGLQQALVRTDNAFIEAIFDKIVDRFYTFLQTSESAQTGTETTFQMALSMAIGRVKDKFKKLKKGYGKIVAFINTLDYSRYLGAANITLQEKEGISYIKNFLGADIIIISSNIPEGTIISTASENIVMYYIDINKSLTGTELQYTTNSTPAGLIGVHKEAKYGRVSCVTHAIYGADLFAEFPEGIARITISPAAASAASTAS